jgi:hypothetical protein
VTLAPFGPWPNRVARTPRSVPAPGRGNDHINRASFRRYDPPEERGRRIAWRTVSVGVYLAVTATAIWVAHVRGWSGGWFLPSGLIGLVGCPTGRRRPPYGSVTAPTCQGCTVMNAPEMIYPTISDRLQTPTGHTNSALSPTASPARSGSHAPGNWTEPSPYSRTQDGLGSPDPYGRQLARSKQRWAGGASRHEP